jgi:hypothetical protein
MTKLDSVTRAGDGTHKWKAVFTREDGRKKTTLFGSAGMQDFTLTGDEEQRARYRDRHRKDLMTNDPTRAGYLSWHLLWGDSTSFQKNLSAYKRRFNL